VFIKGLRVTGCGLWVTGCGLRVVGCGLRVVGCGLRVAGCGSGKSGSSLRFDRHMTFDLVLSKWFDMNRNKGFFAINHSQAFFDADGYVMCLNNIHVAIYFNMQVNCNILSYFSGF
jgi:hypothetical protein